MRERLFEGVQRTYIFAIALLIIPQIAGAQHRGPHHRSHTTGAAPAAFDAQMLATQVALDRAGFSPGEIDGRAGAKTKLALAAFEAASKTSLNIPSESLTTYTITEQDVAGPFIDTLPRDMMEQAKLPALGYTSALELLAEKFHTSPNLLRLLNAGASWKAGEAIKVPAVEPFELPGKGAGQSAAKQPVEIVLSGATRSLTVRDPSGRTLMYAPITSGSEHDPLPDGEWKVVGISWNPVFNYNPDLFWDANLAQSKAKIPAGPNNPVGVVWIDINKPHFGLHGTPEPSTIGRTESHGCVRLTNWDATRLAKLVAAGTKVTIQ